MTGARQYERAALDQKLIEYCYPRQAPILEAVLKHGHAEAARKLGMTANAVECVIRRVRQRAAKAGYAPDHDMTRTAPEGFSVKGVSTLYNAAGEVAAQWVKTNADAQDEYDQFAEAIERLAEPFKGKHDPVPLPPIATDDVLSVYPMGDPHVGMRAWSPETGQDFDLELAEQNLVTAVDQLVHLAPASREALIVNLGDYFHSDNQQNRTARSGNALDVDGRYAKVISVGIRIMRRLIDRALEKHEKVSAICAIDNHDDHSALWLAQCLQQYYERDPRVFIDPSPSKFHFYRFGEVLLGVTHTDTVKMPDLPEIMAALRKKDWGETTFRHWLCGHLHKERVHDAPGCSAETFRTLAPRDAWAASVGYVPEQDMRCDVWHRQFGRVQRHIVGINQVWALQGKSLAA